MLFYKSLRVRFLNSSLYSFPQAFFNVDNYDTPLNPACITRFHNRFRYDENNQISKDEDLQMSLLAEEKARFDSISKKFQKYTDFYFKRSMGRTDIRTRELPEQYDNYAYFSKYAKMGTVDYEVIYRTNLIKNKEELVLDLKHVPFVGKRHWKTAKLAKMTISDDHRYVAFIIDLENNEKFSLGIKDTQINTYLPLRIKDVSNVTFSSDSSFVFFVKYDDKMRSNRVYCRSIFEEKAEEVLLFDEKDEQFYVDITKSKDRKFLILTSATKQVSEIFVLDRRLPNFSPKDLKKLFPREKNARANALHCEQQFFLLTDCGGVFDHKVMELSDERLFKEKKPQFSDYYTPKTGETLKEIDLFKNHMVLYLEKEGISLITIIDLKTKETFSVDINEPFAVISPGLNENYDTESFRFHVDTPFYYNHIYEYNISQRRLRVLEEFKMEGPSFNRNQMKTERVFAPGQDGTKIPISLIYKKTLTKNRKNKLLLHGYGAYGLPMDIGFNITYLAAMENDWILAFAHVRGGNEKGWEWHRSATKEGKMRSFYDYISCAEFLVAEGYTHPSLMCAYGASAGGLLVATVLNLRPNLFKAAVLSVPFLDVLTSLCDRNLPLTVADYEEFGNPLENQRIYDLIRSYCPYENIIDQEYPFVYISMGEEDFRIPLWTVLKYVKRFRERAKNPKMIEEICPKNILVNPLSGGHQGENSSTAGIRQRSLYLGLFDFLIAEKSQDVKFS